MKNKKEFKCIVPCDTFGNRKPMSKIIVFGLALPEIDKEVK